MQALGVGMLGTGDRPGVGERDQGLGALYGKEQRFEVAAEAIALVALFE